MNKDPIRIVEAQKFSNEHQDAWVQLTFICVSELMPKLSFLPESVRDAYNNIMDDSDRTHSNLWLAYKGEHIIGYATGNITKFFYNDDLQAYLSNVFVAPAYRGSWAALKLVKKFEEWARLRGVLHIYLGVARLQQDEARHVRNLFPRLGYNWSGSYYVKETV